MSCVGRVTGVQECVNIDMICIATWLSFLLVTRHYHMV